MIDLIDFENFYSIKFLSQLREKHKGVKFSYAGGL